MVDLVGFESDLFEKLKEGGLIERFSVFEIDKSLGKSISIFFSQDS